MICGARKKDGTECKRAAMPNGKCYLHGGKTPTGIALPQTRHGRYSKYLPSRLSGQYEAAKSDPALLELREDIALIDSRLSDLLQRVDTGESGEVWKELREAYDDLQIAMHAKKPIDIQDALQQINSLIVRGNSDYRAWSEIHEVIEQRRRLVESERKRIVESNSMISAENAMLMISALVDIIRRNINDKTILAKISSEVNLLVSRE